MNALLIEDDAIDQSAVLDRTTLLLLDLDVVEVDDDLVATTSVFVDDREAAAEESGELIHAASGSWSFDRIVGDLAELASGRAGRRDDDEVTLFKSVGLAVEDVVVAAAVVARS